jgi:hypothetical protein
LLEIFGLEKGVLGEQGSPVGIRRQKFENATNGDAHRSDARLPAALSWLDRNPIKQVYRRHIPSLDHKAPTIGGEKRCRILVEI